MIKWTDDLSTGVAEIDAQHKELFERVNGLLSAMGQGKGKEEVAKVLDFLAEYVVTHFGTEERFMKERNYPGYESHRREHGDYIKRLGELKSLFDKQGTSSLLAIESQRLLTGWWFSHIGATDKALGAFISATRKS